MYRPTRSRWSIAANRVVFRAASDAEYFTAHPDAKFRLNLRVTRVSRRYSFFSFKIATRDGEVYATGDSGDVGSDLRRGPGTARERWIRACLLMLTDPHRCTGPVMKSPYWNWKPNHKMTDAELWHFAMSVIEPAAGARQ